jgi:hypothetical protein
MGNRVRVITSQTHTRLLNGWRFCLISISMGIIFIPYLYPNRGIPHGLSGIGSPLTSLLVAGRSRSAVLLAATDTGPPPRVHIYLPSATAEARGRLPARSAGAALELRGYVKSGGVRLSMRRPVLPLATWPRRGVGAGAGRSPARWPCRRSRHAISEARGIDVQTVRAARLARGPARI